MHKAYSNVRLVFDDFLCNFCRTFRCNFNWAQVASSNRVCKLAATSVGFARDFPCDVKEVSNMMSET